MGFEITYSFYEKLDKDYNKEEVKTFKKKVGQPFDDVPLEKLAGAVMAQLARRDIWIIDAEIVELCKKTISFKETKGGIVLKNRKFSFDGGGTESSTITVEDLMETQTQQNNYSQPQQYLQQPQNQNLYPHEQIKPQANTRRPINWVVYSPELPDLPKVKHLKFTIDKKYPVFESKPVGVNGNIFITTDDTGREQEVLDKYFIPGEIQLFGDKELGFSETREQREGGKLHWGSVEYEDMPDIRGR